MESKSVNILGEKYSISTKTKQEEPRLKDNDAFCDWTEHAIVLDADIDGDLGNLDAYKKKVLRHEIIHAFMLESGLNECSIDVNAWAANEEMIDWFAFQGPRILNAWKEADAL